MAPPPFDPNIKKPPIMISISALRQCKPHFEIGNNRLPQKDCGNKPGWDLDVMDLDARRKCWISSDGIQLRRLWTKQWVVWKMRRYCVDWVPWKILGVYK